MELDWSSLESNKLILVQSDLAEATGCCLNLVCCLPLVLHSAVVALVRIG